LRRGRSLSGAYVEGIFLHNRSEDTKKIVAIRFEIRSNFILTARKGRRNGARGRK